MRPGATEALLALGLAALLLGARRQDAPGSTYHATTPTATTMMTTFTTSDTHSA